VEVIGVIEFLLMIEGRRFSKRGLLFCVLVDGWLVVMQLWSVRTNQVLERVLGLLELLLEGEEGQILDILDERSVLLNK